MVRVHLYRVHLYRVHAVHSVPSAFRRDKISHSADSKKDTKEVVIDIDKGVNLLLQLYIPILKRIIMQMKVIFYTNISLLLNVIILTSIRCISCLSN